MRAMSWSEQDSRGFLDLGDYYVPQRERQMAIIGDLVASAPSPRNLVELCCGGGLLTRTLLARFPQARMHAFDGSSTMLAAARKQAGQHADRLTTRPFDLAAEDWRSLPFRADAVVSSLAVHHLDGPGKRALFRDVAAMLAPGGIFVLADLIEPTTAAGKAVAGQMWDDAVREAALARDGNLAAYDHFRDDEWNLYNQPQPPDSIDQPSSLIDQLDWLREAGLETVDVHWMYAGHAIMSGRKLG